MSKLLQNENRYRNRYGIIAGVDEAGRGPIAGPLVVAACIIGDNSIFSEVNDSKQMSAKSREEMYELIINNCSDYYIEIIDRETIDRLNILQATLLGMKSAVNKLKITPALVLIDGNRIPPGITIPTTAIVKGDGKIASIAAASVLAKVTRDRIMVAINDEFPEYGFSHNKGYPTKDHLQAIVQYGICIHHRRSYKPVKRVLDFYTESEITFDI